MYKIYYNECVWGWDRVLLPCLWFSIPMSCRLGTIVQCHTQYGLSASRLLPLVSKEVYVTIKHSMGSLF